MKRYLAILLLMIFAGSAQAMSMFNAYNQAGISIAGTMTMNAAICNQTNTCGSSSSKQNGKSRALKANVANDPINYRVNAKVSDQVKQTILGIATKHARNPDGVRKLIQPQDVNNLFDQLMAKHGLRSSNLVDSITAYWLTNWMVVNRTTMPDRATVDGVRAQMMAAAHKSGYGSRDDGFNQRESELLMWQSILLLASYQNPDMDKVGLSKEINSNIKRQGMDMSQFTVNKNGFVLR
jgi:hypothetical protein